MRIVATFPDIVSANIVQGMLENHGIASVIDNQAMSSLYPTPLSGNWELRLMVNDKDYDEARQLLDEHGDIGKK